MAELAADRARRLARTKRAEHEAELRFWRNLAALSRFARPQELPPLNRYRSGRRRPLAHRIPLQRTAPRGLPSVPRRIP